MHQNASFQHQNPTNYSLLQNVLWYCLYSFICTKFSKLILRKIIKIVAKRLKILHPKCTKFDVGWDSTPVPAGGAYSTPPDSLAGSKGPTSKGRKGKRREGQNSCKKKPGYWPGERESSTSTPTIQCRPVKDAYLSTLNDRMVWCIRLDCGPLEMFHTKSLTTDDTNNFNLQASMKEFGIM